MPFNLQVLLGEEHDNLCPYCVIHEETLQFCNLAWHSQATILLLNEDILISKASTPWTHQLHAKMITALEFLLKFMHWMIQLRVGFFHSWASSC